MALPMILSLLGSGLAGSGALASLGVLSSPLVAGALGAGVGSAIETGDIGEGIKTGLTAGALGALGAQAGGAPRRRAALRVVIWGVLAMAATSAIGALVGQAL